MPRFPRRFRFPWLRRHEIQGEVDAEVQFHLDMRTQALVDAGMDPVEAQAEARRQFGDLDATRHYCSTVDERVEQRARWRMRLDELLQDVRYGIRMAIGSPGFTAAAVLTLALGIGATTAIFSVINAVLLRPLPYADADRLVALFETTAPSRTGESPTSPANYLDWQARSTTLEEMTAATLWAPTLTGLATPDRLSGLKATATLFELLQASPMLGRIIEPGDGVDGHDHVVVVSYGLWQRHLGGDPDAIGRVMRLDNEPYTIVGVMPPGFAFPPFWARDVEVWTPLVFRETETLAKASSRGARFLRVFARLRPGARLAEAQAELEGIGRALEGEYPDDNDGIGINLQPLQEPVVGAVRPALLVLLVTVGLVLVIACANLANLLLSRGTARRHELALRAALGAGQGRLIRQLLTESALMAAMGGAAGIGLAAWGTRILVVLAASELPRIQAVSIDGRVVAVALGLTIASALGFGLAPALRTAGLAAGTGSRATHGRDRQRMQQTLVVAQVALALMLLVGAGLLMRSFGRLQGVDPGFARDGALTLSMQMGASVADAPDRQDAVLERIIEKLEATPGIERAGFVNILHLGGDTWTSTVGLDDSPVGEEVGVSIRTVTPSLFDALGIPVLEGRAFDARDTTTGQPVAIVNETFARLVWPDADPVGRRVKRSGLDSLDPWLTVVGVVGDVHQDTIAAPVRPEIYFPYAQNPVAWYRGATLVVRGNIRQAGLLDGVRRAVWGIDPDLPLTNVRTVSQLLDDLVARERFTTWLLVAFAGTALVLALIGIHGVIAYTVRHRTRELGVRVALGATRGEVLALVARQGVALAGLGTILGLAGALIGSRALESLLYGVTATDPVTIAGVAAALLLAATGACLLAARPAIRVDPATALRQD